MADDPFPFPFEIYPEDWFSPISLGDWFADPERPFEIDLGCGDGSFLIEMARAHPQRNFLGVERLLGRCRKVWKKAERAGIQNVRVLRIDTNYGVKWLLPQNVVSRLHFLCPDPWPKKKHAARRQMCQPEFLRSISDLLKEEGEFLFKTDSLEYFEEALEVVEACPHFRKGEWETDSFLYPETDFERQWIEAGRTMNQLRLLKK